MSVLDSKSPVIQYYHCCYYYCLMAAAFDCIQSQDFPCLSMCPPPEGDTFEGKLLTAPSSDLQELLCGGWILQHYLDRPCPADVAYWLFQILCRHSDRHIIKSSFDILWILTEAAAEVYMSETVPYTTCLKELIPLPQIKGPFFQSTKFLFFLFYSSIIIKTSSQN